MIEVLLLKVLLIAKALLVAGKVPLVWAAKGPMFLAGAVAVSVLLVTMLLVGVVVTVSLALGSLGRVAPGSRIKAVRSNPASSGENSGERRRQRSRVWGMRRASPPSYGALVGYAKRKVEHLVAAEENKNIFIAPGEGTHLPVLDIVHKITADRSD